MSIVLHLLWISLKGLLVFASIFAAGAGSVVLLFGSDTRHSEALPGIMGGGILMMIVVFGGLYVFLGGRA
jgi:hypothetical protein